MKYNYNKNLKKTEVTKPFLRTMAKLDKIQETIKICDGIDDDQLREALEGKQCKLVQQLTSGYSRLFGIEAKYTLGELFEEIEDGALLIKCMNQENITSIEKQIMEL